MLFRVLNSPSNILYHSGSSWVIDSINCRPCLPSPHFKILYTIFCFVSCVWNMLFISNLKFLSSVYLHLAPKPKVGCSSVGLPTLGSMPVDLFLGLVSVSALVSAITCTAAPAVPVAACVIAYIFSVCHFLITVLSALQILNLYFSCLIV